MGGLLCGRPSDRGGAWPAQSCSRWLNLRYSAVYCTSIFLLSPTVFLAVSAIANRIGLGFIDLTPVLGGDGLAWQFAFGALNLLVVDFFYYWMHRAQHTNGWLWEQHKVHHSEESLNVTTATRHSWTEFILQAFAISLPIMILFKLPAVTVTAIGILYGAWGFFIHSNLALHLGGAARVIVGPQGHRIHHSRLAEHADKNFAAYFPLWDQLFGTYWHPCVNEFPPTGLASGEKFETVSAMAVAPFFGWFRKLGFLKASSKSKEKAA
jgi:sterol desaturase/sphingolipid hydroxylase (fatty acid hydroxylase superfamily)